MLFFKKMLTGTAIAALLASGFAIPAADSQVLPAANVTATPTAPTGNATTGVLMAGIGVSGAGGGWRITPVRTGRVVFSINGTVQNSGATDGWTASIAIGPNPAVAAPANGAALPSGSIACSKAQGVSGTSTAAAEPNPLQITCVATGLTPGTLYWADVAYKAVTAGTVTLTNLTVYASEF